MESQTRDSAFDERRVVIGSQNIFWIWLPDVGWDLTRPANLDSSLPAPRLHLECEISNVVIDPTKTALVIIDMQNFSRTGERSACVGGAG